MNSRGDDSHDGCIRAAMLAAGVEDQEDKLILFYCPGTCSLAAHIVLEETGLPFTLVKIDAKGGETQRSRYLAINPKGRVPVLAGPSRLGRDSVLTEVPAILIYLARIAPQAALLPDDALGQARCLEWLNWLSSNVHAMGYSQLWRSHRFVKESELFPAVIARGKENLDEQYAFIESQLADGREWAVAGAGYTVVDPFLLVFYLWGRLIGRDVAGECPAWVRLSERVMARPAVQRTLRKEELIQRN